jgi:hypothetical protein
VPDPRQPKKLADLLDALVFATLEPLEHAELGHKAELLTG